jgi:hypothetical protein
VDSATCNQFVIVNREQVQTVIFIDLLIEPFAPRFGARIRRLQQAREDLRVAHQARECHGVVRRRATVFRAC